MASISTKLSTSGVYATPTGLKIGSKGKVKAPGAIFGQLPKGEVRRLRKELRSKGLAKHASQPRVAPQNVAA